MALASKVSFFSRVVRHRLEGQPRRCPNCGETAGLRSLGRKKIVVEVIHCENCLLIFRWPLETPEEARSYYQSEYSEGAITALPEDPELAVQISGGFRGTSLDLSAKIELLKICGGAGRVLDYGCSWGYGVYQLARAGLDATGFEIARSRARFGREWLGVRILDAPGDLARLPQASFDALFSNHVVEHLLQLNDAFTEFARLLRPGGLAFIVLPNFTGRVARQGRFWNWIGAAHPLAPTCEFFARNLPPAGFAAPLFASCPFDEALRERFRRGQADDLQLEGDELLVVTTRT